MSNEPLAPNRLVMDGRVVGFTNPSDVPRQVAVAMGRTLGISPVVYLGASNNSSTMSVWDHLDVLCDAATRLGYVGATPARLGQDLLEFLSFQGAELMLVALVPDPQSHVAAPPGFSWFTHAEPFTPEGPAAGAIGQPEMAEPMRVGFSTHLRSHRDPSSRILLWDDLGLNLAAREATALGLDSMIVLNPEGRVATIGNGTLLLDLGDRYVTPPLSEGAIDTPWRRHLLFAGDATESPLRADSLVGAENVFAISPWGRRQRVSVVGAYHAQGAHPVGCR